MGKQVFIRPMETYYNINLGVKGVHVCPASMIEGLASGEISMEEHNEIVRQIIQDWINKMESSV